MTAGQSPCNDLALYHKAAARMLQNILLLLILAQLMQGRTVSTVQHLSRVMRKPTMWILTRSDTNQAVQLQKMARGLKFRIVKEEVLYYLCSENKGADQLRSYREADLRLCFRICKTLVFS